MNEAQLAARADFLRANSEAKSPVDFARIAAALEVAGCEVISMEDASVPFSYIQPEIRIRIYPCRK